MQDEKTHDLKVQHEMTVKIQDLRMQDHVVKRRTFEVIVSTTAR